jgi:hypothetical protein
VNDGNNGNNYTVNSVADNTGVINAVAVVTLSHTTATICDNTTETVYATNSGSATAGAWSVGSGFGNVVNSTNGNVVTGVYYADGDAGTTVVLNYTSSGQASPCGPAVATDTVTVQTCGYPSPTVNGTGTNTLTRHANQVLHISIANDILSQVTVGTAGDTLSLTSWSVSTNNITLTSNPAYLNYAAGSPNVTDLFSYTVTDNHANTVTGYIKIIVVDTSLSGTPITGVFSQHAGTSAYTVTYVGVIGATYRVQRATDAQFTQNVTTIHDDVMIHPPVSVIDNSPPEGTAFYRVLLLP